jgi:hypothetical protein
MEGSGESVFMLPLDRHRVVPPSCRGVAGFCPVLSLCLFPRCLQRRGCTVYIDRNFSARGGSYHARPIRSGRPLSLRTSTRVRVGGRGGGCGGVLPEGSALPETPSQASPLSPCRVDAG